MHRVDLNYGNFSSGILCPGLTIMVFFYGFIFLLFQVVSQFFTKPNWKDRFVIWNQLTHSWVNSRTEPFLSSMLLSGLWRYTGRAANNDRLLSSDGFCICIFSDVALAFQKERVICLLFLKNIPPKILHLLLSLQILSFRFC